jgi:methylthioribulose-1-phosphate dehydratase
MANDSDLAQRHALPLPVNHPLFGHESLIDQLRECGALFHHRGWAVGTSGNFSAVLSNDPVRFIVTASGIDKSRMTRDDFVLIGADGKPVAVSQPRSSAETLLHSVLAELPTTGCVLHTHSTWSTLLSDYYFERHGIEIRGYEMLKGLEGITTHEHRHWIPIFENTQNIAELSRLVKQRLHDPTNPLTHGFLIRRHGLYAWGSDVFAARRHIEIFEFLFECLGRKLSLPSNDA